MASCSENHPLVSIITPSYNCSQYIDETIKSIQAQTYKNWELLITDDCSSDNTVEKIKQFADEDSRIKLFRLDENFGAGAARNNSIDKAKGRFIAFCDSDDKWFPNKLEKQLEFMKSKDVALSYTSYMTCDENGNVNGIVVCRKKETLNSMCKDDKMGFLTVVYDVEKIGKVFMPLMRKRQDWALKLRLLKLCEAAYGMKEPLAYYRLRKNSISSNKRSLIKYNINVYKEELGWSTMKANIFFYFVFLPTYLKKRLFLKYLNR